MGPATEVESDGAARPADVVPTVGFVVAAVAALGPLLSLQRGIAEPAIVGATACAGLATLVFLGRRHGAVDRRPAVAFAAIASGGAVVFTGYASVVGTTDTIAIPAVGWSVSIVFGSFLAAAIATSVAIADYGGVSGAGLRRRGVRVLEMFALGLVGIASFVVAGVLLQVPALLVVGEPGQLQLEAISYVAFAIGFGTVAIGYLRLREYGLSYIDLEVPTVRMVLWTIGGVVVILVANVGISALLSATGAEQASHGTVVDARENVEILLVVLPAMLLIVGPAEELLFRNVIQKTLYETFTRYGAVVVASVIFSAVHLLAYATADAGAILSSLVVVFTLSLVLGTIYERTENLLIPALVHGLYNVVVFATVLL